MSTLVVFDNIEELNAPLFFFKITFTLLPYHTMALLPPTKGYHKPLHVIKLLTFKFYIMDDLLLTNKQCIKIIAMAYLNPPFLPWLKLRLIHRGNYEAAAQLRDIEKRINEIHSKKPL